MEPSVSSPGRLDPSPRVTPLSAQPSTPIERGSVFHQLGFYAYCGIALSTTANDLMLRMFGQRAFIYWLAFPAAIILFITCGTTFRGLRDKTGRLWLALGAWMIIGIPMSFWPGGSAALLQAYLPRVHLLFFFITAFVVTRQLCRKLMAFNVFSSFLMLAICVGLGGTPSDTGRFCIPGSLFFVNPNDLAIELLVGIGSLTYWMLSGNRIKIAVSVFGGVLSLLFILKTGSRGALLAVVVLIGIAFFVTKAKASILALSVLGLLMIPFLPLSTLHRLTLIILNTDSVAVKQEDGGNVSSQIERQYLVRKSIELTLTHPLFGVGAGEFIDASSGADARKGVHSAALGTHNSYTQMSSENGFPGLLFYAAALILSIRLMIRLYKATWNRPDLKDITAISYSMWVSIAAFALSSAFHHLAYAGYAPTLCGSAIAIHLMAQQYLPKGK